MRSNGADVSITRALRDVANRRNGHGIKVFREDQQAESIEFEQLYSDAGKIACGLLERGLADEERVAIALPTSIDFARAFFGVIAAGGVPVPIPPPLRFGSMNVYAHRVATSMRQSRVTKMLSNARLRDTLRSVFDDTGLSTLSVDEVKSTSAFYVDVAGDCPALVQYTSGTVGDPKGVVLTNANVLANVASITKAVGGTEADVCCTWLPLFHDMGLIGKLLFATINGMEICMISPDGFIRDPGQWLRMISRCRGTLASAPNSGYQYTVGRVSSEAVRELDLSTWRLALNGAESVDAETIREFCRHFAPAGFRDTAFLPVYGLAEASLAVSFPPIGRPMKTTWARGDQLTQGPLALMPEGGYLARELVSVGTPVANTEVRLMGESGVVVDAEDAVGEIEVRGASVMRGYEGKETAKRDSINDEGWVSTGDLGFRHDGELFVTGRKKEIIIVLGQNYYASDIESIAGAVHGVANRSALAAGIRYSEGEGLALFVETKETEHAERTRLVARVRHAVSSGLGVVPREVILVRQGKLPRTSSGKLERHGLDALYTRHASCTASNDPICQMAMNRG